MTASYTNPTDQRNDPPTIRVADPVIVYVNPSPNHSIVGWRGRVTALDQFGVRLFVRGGRVQGGSEFPATPGEELMLIPWGRVERIAVISAAEGRA